MLASSTSLSLTLSGDTLTAVLGDGFGTVTFTKRPVTALLNHYQVTLKSWIPFGHIVDPEAPIGLPYPAANAISTRGGNPLCSKSFEPTAVLDTVDSIYRGDNHNDFYGSYRTYGTMTFDSDGKTVSNVKTKGEEGLTYRDTYYHSVSLFTSGNFDLSRPTCSETGTSPDPVIVTVNGNSLHLQINSSNPLARPSRLVGATIYADVTGSFRPDDGTFNLKYTTSRFPSIAVQVLENGNPQRTALVNDVSCLKGSDVLGVFGAKNLFLGLADRSNTGNLVVTPSDSGVQTSNKSNLC